MVGSPITIGPFSKDVNVVVQVTSKVFMNGNVSISEQGSISTGQKSFVLTKEKTCTISHTNVSGIAQSSGYNQAIFTFTTKVVVTS